MADLIKIKVTADAPREKVRKPESNRLIIDVREPAHDNRANKRVLEIVRELYPGRPVKMLRGHHTPNKTVEIGEKDR